MMAKNAKRRIGRPRLPDDQRKSRILKFRARREIGTRLKMSAAASERSISGEIEHRLEASFRTEDALGDPAAAAVFHNLASKIAGLKSRYGTAWRQSDEIGAELA